MLLLEFFLKTRLTLAVLSVDRKRPAVKEMSVRQLEISSFNKRMKSHVIETKRLTLDDPSLSTDWINNASLHRSLRYSEKSFLWILCI